eukprot:SAG31_NODE_2090_length_6472_cov_4.683352_6_plen_470_part_00
MQHRSVGNWTATLAAAERGLQAEAWIASSGSSAAKVSDKVRFEPVVAKLHDLIGFSKAMIAEEHAEPQEDRLRAALAAAQYFSLVVQQHFQSMPRSQVIPINPPIDPNQSQSIPIDPPINPPINPNCSQLRSQIGAAAGFFGLTLAHLRQVADPYAVSTIAQTDIHRADGSGWQPAVARSAEIAAVEQGRCDVDVVECVSDRETFLSRYADGNRPVLLRGFLRNELRCTGANLTEAHGTVGWPWPARKKWARPLLLAEYGDVQVRARRSSSLATEYENARGSGALADMMSLETYLDALRTDSSVDDPLYLFEPAALPGARGSDYQTLLALFNSSRRFSNFDLRDSANQISLGSKGSGVGWHRHSPAYNALLFGARRWLLVPPFFTPTNGSPHPVVQVRGVTFSFLRPLSEKYGTFIARCNALIEKVPPCIRHRGLGGLGIQPNAHPIYWNAYKGKMMFCLCRIAGGMQL